MGQRGPHRGTGFEPGWGARELGGEVGRWFPEGGTAYAEAQRAERAQYFQAAKNGRLNHMKLPF